MRNFTESLPPNIEGPLFQGTEEVVWERIVKLFEFFLLLQIYLLHMNGWEWQLFLNWRAKAEKQLYEELLIMTTLYSLQ